MFRCLSVFLSFFSFLFLSPITIIACKNGNDFGSISGFIALLLSLKLRVNIKFLGYHSGRVLYWTVPNVNMVDIDCYLINALSPAMTLRLTMGTGSE